MSADDKVSEIFAALGPDRVSRLRGDRYLADVSSSISNALAGGSADNKATINHNEIGFHLIDWQADAAFLVALSLFPERFTEDEIREGIERFLVHAPSHVVEAARLAGYESDTFSIANEGKPNQSPEPTSPSVTTPAGQEPRQP